MESVEDYLTFLLGGRSVFTLRSKPTQCRFTYEVQKNGQEDFYFVSVRTGPEHKQYLGCIRGRKYCRDRKMRIGADAKSRLAFEWFWGRLSKDKDLSDLELWHEGSCARCGRALTTPESIRTGLGPVCRTRVS